MTHFFCVPARKKGTHTRIAQIMKQRHKMKVSEDNEILAHDAIALAE